MVEFLDIERVFSEGKEIVLVGTAHISQKSVELVKQAIEFEKPDVVGIELDLQRLDVLLNEKKWKEMDIMQVVKEGKAPLFLLNLLLSNIQRNFGEQVGVSPGSEMLEAIKSAGEKNIPIALLDRDVKVTLKRAMDKMSFFEKIKILFSIMVGMFGGEKLSPEKIEELKQKDSLNHLMQELGKEMPSIKEVLVDERDLFIANKILNIESKKIVAVVGLGHIEGIKKYLDKKRDVSEINSVQEKKSILRHASWIIPAIFIALLAYAFLTKGIDSILNFLAYWIIITGTFAALGALISKAHPYSIATAFIAAPLTTLHPALAAGWFSGLVEAKMRKPKVKDFEELNNLNSLGDFSKNNVTHILLVTALTNLGAMIGVVIAFPVIIKLIA